MNQDRLPDNFMQHLEFLPGDVPDDEIIPLLPPGYPLIMADAEDEAPSKPAGGSIGEET